VTRPTWWSTPSAERQPVARQGPRAVRRRVRYRMCTSVVSFGYKHGYPSTLTSSSTVALPNPHWIESLNPLSGLDEPVRDFVLSQEATGPFLDRVVDLVAMLLPPIWPRGSLSDHRHGCTGAVTVRRPGRRAGRRLHDGNGTVGLPPRRRSMTHLGGPGGGRRRRARVAASLRAARLYAGEVTGIVSVADDGAPRGGSDASWASCPGTCANAWWPWRRRSLLAQVSNSASTPTPTSSPTCLGNLIIAGSWPVPEMSRAASTRRPACSGPAGGSFLPPRAVVLKASPTEATSRVRRRHGHAHIQRVSVIRPTPWLRSPP